MNAQNLPEIGWRWNYLYVSIRIAQISRKMDEYPRYLTLHTPSKDEETDGRRHLGTLQKYGESANRSGA